MKQHIIRLTGLFLILVLAIVSTAGKWSANNFFYEPALGARGSSEKTKFDEGLSRVDAHLGKYKTLGDHNYSTLAEALATINNSETTLTIPAGEVVINSDIEIPANITLKFDQGAYITIANGVTLTINGAIEAGPYKIFNWAGIGKVAGSPQVEGVLVEWWGAVGDGTTDDTAAIQAAIDFAEANTPRVVYFQPKMYAIGSQLTVDTGGISLIGKVSHPWGGTQSYSPLQLMSTQLQYTTDDTGTLMKVYNNSARMYKVAIKNIRFGIGSGLTNKPNLLHLESQSEFLLQDVAFFGVANKGLILSDCSIGCVNKYFFADSDYHIYMQSPSGTPRFSSSGPIWFDKGNIWDAGESAICATDTSRNWCNIYFIDSWFERSKQFVEITPAGDMSYSNWVFDNCLFTQDNENGTISRDGWLIKITAQSGTSNSCRLIDWRFNNSRITSLATGDAIIYTKGTNTSSSSYLERIRFDSVMFDGSAYDIVSSDTGSTTSYFHMCKFGSGISKNAGSAAAASFGPDNFNQYVFTGTKGVQSDKYNLNALTSLPSNQDDGDLVYADGDTWDPGQGEGIYQRMDGAWSLIPQLLYGSASWEPQTGTSGTLDSGDQDTQDFTVTGAAMGGFASASPPEDIQDCLVSATVTAADTVTVVVRNETGSGINFSGGTWKIRVAK